MKFGSMKLFLLALVLGPAAVMFAANAAQPDLEWSPNPFVFRPGREVRYIDFENGNDMNPGTKSRPWKHHPWDRRAGGRAKTAKGIDTYCFKQGGAYRGALVAKESGTPGNPIRLTVDPSWGTGRAGFYGSVGIRGGWKRCTDKNAPQIPKSGRRKTWYTDLDPNLVPRLLWEVRNGEVTRIPIARTPNWSVTAPDDPRSEWWEMTGCVLEVKLELDSVEGFKVGERITGTGRWEDFDENRDNIAEGGNRITEVGGNYIRIDAWAWKKGELRKGASITNGRTRAKIKKMSGTHDLVSRLIDDKHLTQRDPSSWVGATLWAESETMPKADAEHVLGFDPREHSLRILYHRNVTGPTTYSRYFLENLPSFLDAPGEYYFTAEGRHAGRLFIRLPGDRNPNKSVIEAATEYILFDIGNSSNIEISGLDIRFSNALACGTAEARHAALHTAAVRIIGTCSHVAVRNCRIRHVANGVIGYIEKKGDVLDFLDITDNDMHDIDGGGIGLSNGRSHYLLKDVGARLVHVSILRNRLQNVGSRRLRHWGIGLHAVQVEAGEVVEVAGNIVDRTWGAGIMVFNGGDYGKGKVERPLIRTLIHHNKATNTLLGLQDYGGIASWMCGPSYVYCNISGNPVGYKHIHYRRLKRKDWYRTSCYGVGIYMDGQYKSYVFNNIVWGKNNNVNDRIYNSAAFNEAMGFMNVVFNNTMYRFGVGLHKGMTQHNRCSYLGNLLLDIGHKFIQQEPTPSVIEYDSLAYARNVFHGTPPNFGQLGRDVFPSFEEWRKGMMGKGVMAAGTGIHVREPQVIDAAAHDFRLRPSAAAIDRGAKVFVPWSLYSVVGEWSFCKHRSDPAVILGENVNWNEEWYTRSMFQDVPRNDLHGRGIGASNFVFGTLENWIEGALELNGRDEYCEIPDAELKKGYEWRDARSRRKGTCPGEKRVTVDMNDNGFLIEVVFRTRRRLTRGGIVSKCGRKGYVLELAADGTVKMTLHFGRASCSRTSGAAVNDGEWHHVIAEVDRTKHEGINIYVDGKLSNGAWSGRMDAAASLSNTAAFTVGKTQGGAAGGKEEYFAGALDFLRVSRGTLADAETTIEELYEWEFNGPFLRDFYGKPVKGKSRDAGAIER